MTKAIKKGLLAVLLLGLCFACAFLGLNTTRAFAELTDNEQTFVNNYAAFLDVADGDDSGDLSAAEIRGAMGDPIADAKFMAMYMHVNNMASDTTDPEYVAARDAYDDILAGYNQEGAVQLYSDLTTRATYIYTRTGYSYENADEVAGYRATFDAIFAADVEDLAFLKNALNYETTWVDTDTDTILDTPVQLVNAEAKIAEWKAAIDDAIAAIEAISVWNNVDAMEAIWDTDHYIDAADYTVVLTSQATIAAARTAVNTVDNNGDVAYLDGTKAAPYNVNHLEQLVAAEAGLAAQVAKVTAVENKIDLAFASYSEIVGAEVCYTIADLITDAKDDYDALDDDTVMDGNNDLKGSVNATKKTNLDTMVATLAAVTTAIGDVETAITAIPAASYTNAFKSAIDAARTAFDALPNDVKTTDNATPNTCVTNYQTLLDHEGQWADYVEEVETVIEKINNLQVVEANEPENIFAAFIEVFTLYNGLTDKTNQLNGDVGNGIVGVDGSALDEAFRPEGYLADITTCKGSYDYYQGVANDIATAVNPIKTKIDELYGIYNAYPRFVNDFESKINALTAQIAALPHTDSELDPRYKGAIDNYAKYETLMDKYAALITLANAWADAVDAIGTVSVSTFDLVAAAEEAFAAITPYGGDAPYNWVLATDISTFAKQYNTKAYSAYYTTYTAAVGTRDTIVAALDAAKAAALALDRPEVANGTNYADYAEAETAYTNYGLAVDAVAALYDALDTYDAVAGETKAYFAENETYAAAYTAYADALIFVAASEVELKISKIDFNSGDDVDYITQARTAYDALTADEKAEVRNYDVLEEVEADLADFKDAVDDLLNGAGFDGSDVDAVTVAAVTQGNVTTGFYKLDVDAAQDLVDAYGLLTNVEKAYDGVGDKMDLLVDMFTVAGTNANVVGDKLYFIDNLIDDFNTAFNNNAALPIELDTLKGFVDALTDSQRALLVNAGMLDNVADSQEMAIELATAIDLLYNDVAEGKVNAISAINYYTIKAVYDSLSQAKKDLVKAQITCDDDIDDAFEFIKDKVDEDGVADDNITAAIEALQAAQADFATTQAALAAKDAEIDAAIAELNTAKAALEAKDTELTNAIATLNAAKTALEGKDAEIDAAIAELNTAKTALQAKDAEIDAAITELNTAKAALQAKDAEIDAAIAELNTAKAALEAKDGELETAVTALNAAKTALEGKDDELEAKDAELEAAVTALNAAKAALEAKDAEFEAKFNDEKAAKDATIEELNSQIDALKSKSTLTIIIFAIACGALCACVVVLFIARKKA